jgi:hypothetical protein
MNIERRAQGGGGLEDRPVVGMVEISLAGPTEQHGAVQAELGHGAFQLAGGGLRMGRG